MSETVPSGSFVPYQNNKPIIPPVVINEEEAEVVSEQQVPASPPKGVSVFFLALTLLGTRLGAGIVGIPYATKVVGYLFAL